MFLSTLMCEWIVISLVENNLYTISIDLFIIDSCAILYLQYDVNMIKIRIELEIYIEIY